MAALATKAKAVSSTISNLLKSANKDLPPALAAVIEAKKEDKKDDKKEEPKAAAPEAPKDSKEQPAPAPKADGPKDVPGDKAASGDVIVPEFTGEFHAKIGSALLQFAEGRDMVEKCLRQLHGAQQAEDIIKAAAFMEEHALALQQAELEGATQAEQLMSEMSAEDMKVASYLAEAHAYDLSQLKTVEEQEAYKAAAASAAQMADAGGGEMEAPPEGHDGKEVTPEDIMQVVQYLMSEGKISPEEAEQIMSELSSGGAEGGHGGQGGPEGAEGGHGGPSPEELDQMPPEQKEAYVKAAAAERAFDQLVAEAIK